MPNDKIHGLKLSLMLILCSTNKYLASLKTITTKFESFYFYGEK
jgi:hypothetical protein